ncbi:MAG: ABC transporter permease subunit [Bdellovibrionales bacterium]|nr:ABC transporter permease subunit [Bdellovibrionales bacterium]
MTAILIIALNTLRESIRSKIMYSLLFFAIAVVLVASFFANATIGDQIIVIKDFGLFALSLFTVAYTVIAGSSLLYKELSRKTVFNILSKPVRRGDFVIGKFLGMLITVTLMLLAMSCGLILFLAMLEGRLPLELLAATLGIFWQLVIVCAAAIFFSSIVVTPLLSGAFTFGIYLAGRSTEYLLFFVEKNNVEGLSAKVLNTVYILLPHLNSLDVSDQAVYQEAISGSFYLWSSLYSCGYAVLLLVVSQLCFTRKEFH